MKPVGVDSSRYPWTYACDLIRSIPERRDVPGLGKIECILSRADASRIIQLFADATSLSGESLAVDLANLYLEDLI